MQTRVVPAAKFLLILVGLFALFGCGGNKTSVPRQGTAPDAYYQTVLIADLNRDGKLDIAASFLFSESYSGPFSGWVSVFLQDPANPGAFQTPTNYRTGDYAGYTAVGDLDGDSQPDLAISGSSGAINVLLQDGTGSGRFLPPVSYVLQGPSAVAIADFDGDGKPDLAVDTDQGVSILLQNPGAPGTFLSPTTINAAGGQVALAATDLDGDGKPDLIVPSAGGVTVLLQNPALPITFLSPVTYSAGSGIAGIAVADLDGDGKPDIAVANRGELDKGTTPAVTVLLQNPAVHGTFFPATNYNAGPGPSSTSSVAIGDLNGDGKPDLVVSNGGGSNNSVSVFLQNPAIPGTFQTAVNYFASHTVNSVAIGDMKGDGKPDLVLACQNGIVVRFQDPNASGVFQGETYVTK